MKACLDEGGHPLALDYAARLAEASSRLRAHHYELVIADLNLPDGTGLDTFFKVKELADDAAIVVMTGVDDALLASQAVQAGAQDYLVKGDLKPKRVLQSLYNALARQDHLLHGAQPALDGRKNGNGMAINIAEMLREEAIIPHFQPLVSIKRRSIIGFEGLSRGWDRRRQALIPAPQLFGSAMQQGLSQELDLLCRSRILNEFGALLEIDPDFILTVNIDVASAIEANHHWFADLQAQVSKAGLTSRNVVIEILESAVKDDRELLRFVEASRRAGYMIALDDVGAGHSNLNRVPAVKPDIIKVDRFLVDGIDRDFYKQEVFKSLLSMARHLGTLAVAEGVETEPELNTLLELGVDIIQGYRFARPNRVADLDLGAVEWRVERASLNHREWVMDAKHRRHLDVHRFDGMIRDLQKDLARHDAGDFAGVLDRAVRGRATVECLYVLDDSGRQITE
ncbi:MAG TPA: EAL domain-containing response regulator, partial [bacterium]|nr:EAL domain-containing response regulator [bacterium]